MKCPICNTENTPEASNCHKCGFGQGEKSETDAAGASLDSQPSGNDMLVQAKDDIPVLTSIEHRDGLLQDLRQGIFITNAPYVATRKTAAEELGRLSESDEEVLRELIAAMKSDGHPDVCRAAANALQAPIHQALLQQHPDLASEFAVVIDRRSRTIPAYVDFVGVDGWGGLVARSVLYGVGRFVVRSALYGLVLVYYGLAYVVGWRRYTILIRFETIARSQVILSASAAQNSYDNLSLGTTVRVKYATQNPQIAILEGEG